MNFVFAAFLPPLFLGMAVIIESLLSNKTFKHPTTMIFYVSLMNALFLPLLLFLGMPTVPSVKAFACYVGVAAISVGYLYPYYLAMKVIDASIVAALFSLGQITVPIVSYLWLGEELSFTQYIGFTVIVMASVALSVKGNKIPKLNKAFYYMLFAAFIVSFGRVLEKYALETDSNWINLAIYPNLISGCMPLAFLGVKKWRQDIVKNFPPYLQKFKIFAVNEFICFLGTATGVYALSGLSPVITTAVAATQPIFMLVLSLLLCRHLGLCLMEKTSPQIMLKKLFCFVLIVLGVMLTLHSS